MRYEAKKDWVIGAAVWGSVLITLAAVLITPGPYTFYSAGPASLIIAFVLWIYFGTYYELQDDYLYARSGPFVEKIYYDKIIEIKKCANLFSSMALCRERLLIRTTRKSIAGLTYISPVNREEFFNELKKRCKNLT